MPASSLFPCSASPQPCCFCLAWRIACEPAAEQLAKGTVATRLISPLAVMCRGLAGEQPGAEVSCRRGRWVLSRGSWCFLVGTQCIFSLKSLPSEGVVRMLQAAGGRRCSAIAWCRGDAASLDFPSKPSLGLELALVLLQNNLSKPGAEKTAGMGSGRSALSPPLHPVAEHRAVAKGLAGVSGHLCPAPRGHRRGDGWEDLAQQPAQPVRHGGSAGRDRRLYRAESLFGGVSLSRERLCHPRWPVLGPSAWCDSGGTGGVTSFAAVGGGGDPGCKPWGWGGDAKSPGIGPLQAPISLTASNQGWHQAGGSGTPKGQPFCCPSADGKV